MHSSSNIYAETQELLPPKLRPKTNSAVARSLIVGALGGASARKIMGARHPGTRRRNPQGWGRTARCHVTQGIHRRRWFLSCFGTGQIRPSVVLMRVHRRSCLPQGRKRPEMRGGTLRQRGSRSRRRSGERRARDRARGVATNEGFRLSSCRVCR